MTTSERRGVIWRIDRTLQLITTNLVALALLAMVGIVVTLVVCRYFFGIAFFWGEEMARYAMIYMAFLGGAVAIRADQHPRLLIFVGMLPQRWQFVLDKVGVVLMAVTLSVLFVQGLDIALNEGRMRTPALRIPYFWIFIAVPIGAGAMLIQLAFRQVYATAVSINEDDDIREVTE